MPKSKSLYEQIGQEKIKAVIADFYNAAIRDVLIGHFFFGKDHQTLIDRQVEFTSKMLGGEQITYAGKPVPAAHRPFLIGEVHYRRRHVLLREAMTNHGLRDDFQDAWIAKEDILKAQVMTGVKSPLDKKR